jgi:general nucleoside transport system permease protein
MKTSFFSRLKRSLIQLFHIIKPSLIAISIGLIMGFIVMLIFNPAQSFQAFLQLLMGGLNRGTNGIGTTIYRAAPIILTGLSVAFAFKTGLFNIGASGQMMIGAYVSIHIGVLWNLPEGIHSIVAIIGGILGGMLWGVIVGLLKAYRNVNEVVTSIMMNYIAANLIIILIQSNVYNGTSARSLDVQSSALLPSLNLFAGSSANIGFGIAVIIVILTHILIHKTTLGFELRTTGFSFDGATYAGMNIKRNTLISFLFSGAFAGLAGAVTYLVSGKTISIAYTIFTEGFDGISVALLGLGEPIGALFAGLFLSHLRQGGFYMQLYGFVPEIVDIIISVIIYASAIAASIPMLLKAIKKSKASRKESK